MCHSVKLHLVFCCVVYPGVATCIDYQSILSLLCFSLGDISPLPLLYTCTCITAYMYLLSLSHSLSPSLSLSLSLPPSPSLPLSLSFLSQCSYMYVYMSITIIILFLLSVITLRTCVFSSVKACQLNKSDAWKVYAVVGSTILEFCFGVKSGF